MLECTTLHGAARCEALDHGRRGKERGARPAQQQRSHLLHVEAAGVGDDVDGTAEHVRHRIEARPVRERRSVQQRVAGNDGFHVAQITLRHRAQIGVGDDHTFRAAGRTRGVEEPGRVVGGNGRGRSEWPFIEQCPMLRAAERCDTHARQVRESMRPLRIGEREARSAVLEHERELAHVQLGIHGHGDGAAPPRGEHRGQVFRGIARNQRHAIAGRHAGPAQTGGEARHGPREVLVIVHDRRAGCDGRKPRPAVRSALQECRDVVRRRRDRHARRRIARADRDIARVSTWRGRRRDRIRRRSRTSTPRSPASTPSPRSPRRRRSGPSESSTA